MSHYRLEPYGCYGPRRAYRLLGPTSGTLDPAEPAPAVRFNFGTLPPRDFTSYADWRRWFERQGHTVEVLT